MIFRLLQIYNMYMYTLFSHHLKAIVCGGKTSKLDRIANITSTVSTKLKFHVGLGYVYIPLHIVHDKIERNLN